LKTSSDSASPTILAIENLSVSKGQQTILDGVSLNVLRGEIHAILGSPGSGKSTLIRAIAGVTPSTRGRILFEGFELKRHSPRVARKIGIEAVLNESTMYPALTLCENISIGRIPRRKAAFHDTSALHQTVCRVISDLSLSLDPDRPLVCFSIVEQYLAQLVKAICFPTKLLLIDEISMKLPPPELESVKHALAILRQRGTTILYSTNNMDEIFNFASRVSILKNGTIVATSPLADIDKMQLVQMTYSFLSSREELVRNNFELFYLKNFYESVFDGIPAPIMVTDTKGTIIVVNNMLKELLNVGQGESPPRTFSEILSLPEDVQKQAWDTIKSGRMADVKAPNGVPLSAFALRDEDDAFTGVMFLASRVLDGGFPASAPHVSDFRIRSEKLIARAAHEIRNPLGIILNYLKLITTEESIDKIHENARNVENEVRRIKHITEDILSQSMRKRTQTARLQDIVSEVIGLVRPTADSDHIEIAARLHGDYFLRIDAELFKQVILNIMINAVEAMPDGGKLEISDSIESRENTRYLVIDLTDTGTGVPADQVENIFEAFFTTKNRDANQGLGLSICREIMTQLSGFITVRSAAGKGSTFQVFLPHELILDDSRHE
jgi:signal transduction histidine kinase/ABC-type molybdenum transport system ATPase subunit/photorepair protein PhrA